MAAVEGASEAEAASGIVAGAAVEAALVVVAEGLVSSSSLSWSACCRLRTTYTLEANGPIFSPHLALDSPVSPPHF